MIVRWISLSRRSSTQAGRRVQSDGSDGSDRSDAAAGVLSPKAFFAQGSVSDPSLVIDQLELKQDQLFDRILPELDAKQAALYRHDARFDVVLLALKTH